MRYTPYLALKAVSALVVVAAFFLSACQPGTAVKKLPEKEVAPDIFAMAEQDFRAENYDKALKKYQIFLEQNPRGERPRAALYRIARINYDNNLYDKALTAFERITTEYPGHPETPMVRYDIADTLYRKGDYSRSKAVSLEWLETYSDNPLKGEVLFLQGKNFNALGERSKAFLWWLKAAEAGSGRQDIPERRDEIDTRLNGLIERSPIADLKEMAGFGVGSVYIPPLYHRMASISFDEDRLEEAKRFAMILVRSTPEQYWVSKGREILNRIIDRMVEEEEASVRKGVIGCLLPLSGPYALYGQELLNGIQLGMGIFDSKEGDQQIELVIRDTRGNEEEAILGVEELAVRENVMAIIGPLASRPATAAASMAQELGVPIVTLTQKDGITEEGDMVFRNFLTPSKEVETLLKEAIEVRGLRSFAIFYPDNPYGSFFMDLFWDKAEEMGGTITAVESYKQDETDFAVQIKKMVGLYYPRPESVNQMLLELKQMEAAREEAENPDLEGEVEEDPDPEEVTEEEEPEPIVDFDAVFIPGSYQNVALIAPQFPFYNIFNIHFLGTSLWRSYELIETTGDYIQGAIFPSGFFSEDTSDGVQAFVKAYRETFESDPGVLAADGYDTIRFVKNLVNRGIINTRKDFQAGLFQEDGFYGVTGEISFDKQGEVKKDPVLLTISGRRLRKFR